MKDMVIQTMSTTDVDNNLSKAKNKFTDIIYLYVLKVILPRIPQ